MRPKGEVDETLVCEICGRFGAIEIGDQRLCGDCIQVCGSCCREFGGDDLWETRKENQEPESRE